MYAFVDPSVAGETLVAHTDAVWDLAVQPETDRLLSCSADGTCRLWNPELKSPLLCTYKAETGLLHCHCSSDFYNAYP